MRKFHGSLLALSLSAGAVSALAQRDRPIELEIDSFSLDRKSNVTTFDGLRIDAGRWSLVADSATANAESLDFQSGEWRFEGNVRVVIDTATVVAQRAVFAFSERELVSGELWGEPVTFEDAAPERDGPVVGQAQVLRYDTRAGTVELLGRVALTVGPYQTTGCDLVYFLDSERFTTGSTACAEPFRTVIAPKEQQTDQTESEP